MAKKGNRQIIKLVNPKTGTFYVVKKNRVNTPDKLEVMKFDPKGGEDGKGGHELFTERKSK